MRERIEAELSLIRQRYGDVEYVEQGHWVRIPSFQLPEGWSPSSIDVVFQIPAAYPGAPPYGIYVPSGITFNGAPPANYKDKADNQPPFSGSWGVLSWQPADGQWQVTADLHQGSNLLNWVLGFSARFREGR